jgi:hypothetical protein
MKKTSLVLALVLSVIVSTAQTWTNVNGRWGYEWLRATKALFIPVGNGAPSGTASLNSAGYKGQAAIYSDTTNKKLYMFNPKDSTWTDVTAGGSGSVTSVSGTVNRITITNPTTTPVIDISSSYIGQASITTLGTIGTGVWNGTGIGPLYGGTGQTTVTTGDMLYGSSSNTWAKLPGVATGNALISGGVGTAFAWGKIGLTTHVLGILPVANGGTGTATPGLVQGANVTITGTWPNQTINASGGGGSSLTAGIQTSVTNSKINYDPRINSNLIFNDFLTSSAGAGWNTTSAGSTTITFSAGHMRLVGGSGSDIIYDSNSTAVHRWTEEVRGVIQSVGGSDYFSFGIQSQGIQTILFKVKNSDLSGTATYSNGASTLGTTAAQGTTTIGDSVIYRIRRDNYTLYFDVVNVTQATSQTLTFNYSNIDGSATVIPFRAFEVTLNPVAGTIDIDYVKLYNQERLYADWLVVGHSIAEGFNAIAPDSTYYNRLQNYFPDKRFALYAVSGSKAAGFTNAGYLKDHMLSLRPKRALIMLGVNEIQASVSAQTFIANMRALVDTIENHGTQVIICNTTPYNAANKAAIIAYNSALLTEFGTQVINIYDTLEVNGLMQSSSDSLHPDEQGHRYMFNVLKDEITRLTNTPYNPEGIIRVFPRGVEAGTASYGAQSNFGIIPLNVGASGTTSPGIGYNIKFKPTNVYEYKETDFANLLQLGNSGKFSFKLAASGIAGDPITFTEVATISTGGDLGIGETVPLAPLHIKRNQFGKTVLGEASMLILDNISGGVGQRQEIGMGYRNANAYSPVVLGNVVTSNTDFTISDFYIATRALTTNTTPVERFRITAAGNIKLTTADISSNSDSAFTWNRSSGALEYSKINTGASGTTPIDAQYTDANNTGTSETDLYTKTTAANTLPANGNVLTFETWGLFNDATATANLQFYFAGTAFGGTGALSLTSLSTWSAHGTIVRTGTSTARAYVTVQTNGGDYISTATLGGINFATTNILKVTGTAGGAGGGSNDITGQAWKVVYQP